MSVSIDICDSHIKIIEGEEQGNNIKIKKTIVKDINISYIHNGYVTNKIDLTLALTDIVNEYNLKNKDCYLSINSTDTITKELVLPKTKGIYLKNLVKNSIKELFGDTTNLCLDYHIYEEFKKDDKDFYKIFVYGMPLKIVQDYKVVITNSGLIPKGLDIKRNCISKILNYKINDNFIKNNTTLFIEISGNNMVLNLMSGNIALYKRDIDISEDVKREKIFLNQENKEEEENFLKEVAATVTKNDDEITFLEEQDHFLEEASFISPILLRVSEEIHKIMQFSMSLNNANIERVYLYGDRENLEEIEEYIDSNIISPTEKIREISNVISIEKIDISKFFNAIGNILRK